MKDHVLISFILIAILLFGLALGGTILVMNLTKSKDVQIPNLVKNSAGTRLTEAQAVEIYNKTEFKKKNDLKIEYVEDETINGFYNQLQLVHQTRRLDYLLINMQGLHKKLEGTAQGGRLAEAILTMQRKRNKFAETDCTM